MLETVRDRERNAQLPRLRWALLSNTTQEPLRPFLKQLCYDLGYDADVWIGGFDTALQDASSAECAAAEIVVIALRLQVLAPSLVDRFAALTADEIQAEQARAIDYVAAVAAAVRKQSRAAILVHNFETPLHPALGVIDYRSVAGQVNSIRRLNLDLADRLSRDRSTFIIDLDAIRARHTADAFVDPRTWHIGRVPYTRQAMRAIAGEYLRIVRAAKGRNRKCVVVDADGTLWGGIVGDDGADGVRVGRSFPGSAFYEFQQALLALRDRGILLALCSKNDRAAVDDVFATRAADMPLRLEHFAAIRVNWTDKAQNIREIAAELNIGVDSLVFVDDNPHETALVSELLPAVHTILLPEDPVAYRNVLEACDLFDTLTFSDEDRRRSDMYAAEQRRRVEESSSMSVDDYLRGLEMEIVVDRVNDGSIARVAQLTQKTNQFNLTTRRYTESDIRQFADSSDHDVLAVRVRDRLGDSGIVGVAILRHDDEGDLDRFVSHELSRARARRRGRAARRVSAGEPAARRSRRRRRVHPDRQERARGRLLFGARFQPRCGRPFPPVDRGEPIAFPSHFKSVVVDGEQVVS